jgi:hypothetical protein
MTDRHGTKRRRASFQARAYVRIEFLLKDIFSASYFSSVIKVKVRQAMQQVLLGCFVVLVLAIGLVQGLWLNLLHPSGGVLTFDSDG